jgi:hypothetical protein
VLFDEYERVSVSLMDFNGEMFSRLDTALRGGEPEGEVLREGATRQGGEMANRSTRRGGSNRVSGGSGDWMTEERRR